MEKSAETDLSGLLKPGPIHPFHRNKPQGLRLGLIPTSEGLDSHG
jgi:hypothetical protein